LVRENWKIWSSEMKLIPLLIREHQRDSSFIEVSGVLEIVSGTPMRISLLTLQRFSGSTISNSAKGSQWQKQWKKDFI
jgi:hypothetical protein